MSRDIIWQPGHVAEEGIAIATDGLRDLIVKDKLVPFDLQQLSLALHVESLEGTGVDREESLSFSCSI